MLCFANRWVLEIVGNHGDEVSKRLMRAQWLGGVSPFWELMSFIRRWCFLFTKSELGIYQVVSNTQAHRVI